MPVRVSVALAFATLCALLMFSSASAQIQLQQGYQPAPLGKDTLCFAYHFEAGDTLVYDIDARDSIWVEGQGYILKLRRSSVSIICDSAYRGMFWLRQTITSSQERQSSSDTTSARESHPWVGRTLKLVMDTLGRRSYAQMTNPDVIGVHPGGPFSPLLLPPLGESCGRQNQSWILDDTLELTENGVPAPFVISTALWRVIDKVDTLGRLFRQIQYSGTARGLHKVQEGGMAMTTGATINSFGKISFDDLLKAPFHVFATSENKLDIELKNGVKRAAMQKTSVNAQLHELRSRDSARTYLRARRK